MWGTGGTRRLDYGEDQLNDALKQVMIINAKKSEIDTGKYANEKKVYSFAEVDNSLKQHRLIKKINISTFELLSWSSSSPCIYESIYVAMRI